MTPPADTPHAPQPDAPMTSEADFLALIDRYFPNVHPHMFLARGDDCAVVATPGSLAVSSDLFIEGAHFRRSYFAPRDIGYKALAASVSDMAAMAAAPLGFNLQLFGPAQTPAAYWEALLCGMAELAREHNLALTGGDLGRAPLLGLGVTIWGQAGPSGRLLARGGARPGDLLFVVGPLGLARAGLMALEEDAKAAAERCPACVAAHLRPAMHVAQALELAAIPGVRGLMDVSDGLAADLPRFLAAGMDATTGRRLGAELTLRQLLHPEVLAEARRRGEDPSIAAYLGGEDYSLLGAAAPEAMVELIRRVPQAKIIGMVDAEPRINLDEAPAPAPAHGFDHFQGV